MNANPTNPAGTPALHRPKLAFYHANARGTGCAMKLELHPAHDTTSGSIMMTVANQSSVGDMRGANPTFARFDWKGSICVKLDFDDLCKFLQVFRGELESIDDGRGLYHSSECGKTRIVLRHLLEPTPGYSLELYRTAKDGKESRAHMLISVSEAIGLCESIAGSLSVICFGIPMVIPHERTSPASASAAAAPVQEGARDANAA